MFLRHTMSSTIIGLIGIAALTWFVAFTAGESIGNFWNPAGITIVLGGTVAATFIAFRSNQLAAITGAIGAIFRDERSINADIKHLVQIARLYRGGDIPQTQEAINKLTNPFLRLGLQFAIDGTPIDDLMHVMNWRIQKLIERETAEAKLFRMLASFSPAFGMLGTLVGLIGMLANLGSGDLNLIGQNMSIALITTVYGLMLANMVFKPVAIKLEQRTAQRVAMMNVLLEGVILLRMGRGPGTIADQMQTLVRNYRDEIQD
ncbi:MotA/TolQ/ExbB proton channel family protein [Nisaea acidiphila]|uniref:MotA/TolQ/ExbB proton channel family protein n=1 Tax=Nisaea acidiphila TaxID=1862145 RepID=A0A9J7B2P7_9PROT|nr:MotA/TolQ/ExbB proton channel family protein [Nisaea acidiphila]UUX51925.1 MotA/TolQ/ExbB proton channel family protein [Nisaea acidiphila]